MYKGLSLIPFCRYFTLSLVNNTRGHSAKVLKNRCSLDLRGFFFSERVVDRWNSLVYHSMWLTLQASMCSRMVSVLSEEIWWAFVWTDWSVWLYGLTCFWDPLEQVRPHLVSYLNTEHWTLNLMNRLAAKSWMNEYRYIVNRKKPTTCSAIDKQ